MKLTPFEHGGPAFPYVLPDERDPESGAGICEGEFAPGMMLRDWFAGQALAGLLADPENMNSPEKNAKLAYASADALLVVRSQHQKP